MTPVDAVVLFALGAIGSGINAVAGGGSLVTFPTLTLGLGLTEKVANATSSVGLFPGSIAGGIGFANHLGRTGRFLKPLLAPSVLGSVAGALLLLNTSDRGFALAVPWLILLAAVLLLMQPHIRRWAGRHESEAVLSLRTGLIVQTFVGIYGGYFGAGMGIMMLAAFSLYMEGSVHEINAVKNWLGLAINGTCSVVFLLDGVARWHFSVVMILGSLVGGYYAARVSQRLDPNRLRTVIGVSALVMAGYYFYRAFSA